MFLHPSTLRACRQLQHGGGLTGDKPRDQHHLATRKFERVMMDVRIVHIELPEPGNLVLHARLPEQTESAVIFDLLLEGEFGAGSRQTTTSGSPTAAKPRVIDFENSVTTSLSPTLAGREATR